MTQALLPGHQSVHPCIWIAFMWILLSAQLLLQQIPFPQLAPPHVLLMPAAALLPGTEVSRHTFLTPLTLLEGVLISIWTELNAAFFFSFYVVYGLITAMIKGSKLDWHVFEVNVACFFLSACV